jgi:hypothetical protein
VRISEITALLRQTIILIEGKTSAEDLEQKKQSCQEMAFKSMEHQSKRNGTNNNKHQKFAGIAPQDNLKSYHRKSLEEKGKASKKTIYNKVLIELSLSLQGFFLYHS